METKNEDEIKRILKRAYPQIKASATDKVCPSEDALASFTEGKLEGKKEEQVISHLAFCNDCVEMIKFLRQKPSEEEVSVPLWLEETVRDLFPEKPKTWEIVVGHVRTVLEVVKHTAEECWTIPGLELIPAKMNLKPPYSYRARAGISDENLYRIERNVYRSSERHMEAETEEVFSIRRSAESARGLHKEFEEEFESGLAQAEIEPDFSLAAPAPISTIKDKILRSLRKRISNGFVFVEHIGPYDIYLAITKKEDKKAEIFEVEIDARDRSGKPAKDIEISFIQGRKPIDKLVTKKEGMVLKRLAPQKYIINFEYKNLYLGKALLDLKEEKRR